uniref:Splicing factor, arginine/serine-rich 1/9 n=1 Tax=Nannochloropsis gaditana (strain CCMP526) TaxID=1093141 RepID=I2CRG1_NANGC
MSCRIYVGNLPMDVRERDLDDLFYKYGRIRGIDIKRPSRPPAYAFVAFEDPRDAKDAVHYRDNYDFDGGRIRVELANETPRRRDDRGFGGGRNRTDFRLEVSDLPDRTSWQDLKDYFKPVGDVLYADVSRNGEGVVEFATKEDMFAAKRKLDGSTFRNPFDSREIRVRLPKGSNFRSSSRSRSRSRSPPRRARSPLSRSRSPPPKREREGGRDGGREEREEEEGRGAEEAKDRSPSPPREKEGGVEDGKKDEEKTGTWGDGADSLEAIHPEGMNGDE